MLNKSLFACLPRFESLQQPGSHCIRLISTILVGAVAFAPSLAKASPEHDSLTSDLSSPSFSVEQDASLNAIHRFLELTPDQITKLDSLMKTRLSELKAIGARKDLTEEQKRPLVEETKGELYLEMGPFLTEKQLKQLPSLDKRLRSDGTMGRKQPFIPLVALTLETYYPSNSTARSIFGDSQSSFQFGFFEIEQKPDERTRLVFGSDTFSIGNSNNKLFVGAATVSYEYRVPIQGRLSAFTRVSTGPAYMDYSFNNPDGQHFGAKRFGVDGVFSVGLRYGRAQISAAYRALTQPAGINFNGVQVDLTYIVVRF